MSLDERAVSTQRIELHQRIRIGRTQAARLTIERADYAGAIGVSFVRNLGPVGWIVRYIPDASTFDERVPAGLPRAAALGRNLNDPIRGCRSILRGGCRSFEDFVGLYVLWVDVIEARWHLPANADRSRSSGATVSNVVVEANSIYDNERLVGER